MSSSVPFEDLVQEGFLGLMHGIDQYDPTRGVKLITYATHHIDGHLRHFLRDRVQIIKEPAWLQEVAQKVRREVETLTQELGREPSDSEVAGSLGLTESEVARINATRSVFAVSSLDEAQESGAPAAHVAEDNIRPMSTELPIEDRVVLESALVRLKEIEQKVLYSYYYEDKSQTDIARQLGVSNNYISHILKNSARKLQQMFRSDAVREAALQHERRRRRLAMYGPEADEGWEDPSASIVDTSTGLYSRKYFEDRLEEEVTRAKRHDLALSVMRVKIVNNPTPTSFSLVAGLVKDCTRKSDLVARVSDSEIAAMLPHTGEQREVVCQRLCRMLAELQEHVGERFAVQIGAASYPEHRSRTTLYEAAAPKDTQS